MAREINLVPDIKNEMIKTLKLRNYIFFACIVVSIASIAAVVITGLIAGGQQIAINNRKDTIDKLSEKITSYSDLNDFLTIKNQLDGISNITNNKQVLSRTFDVLTAIIPTGPDTITVSELNVDLTQAQPILNMEAQANAGQEPYIDYNVLESFKKSMDYMRYDWGEYVDKEGNKIPAYCMIETGTDGATLKEVRDGKDNYYAYWAINGDGCNPSESLKPSDYEDSKETYNGQEVIRIWRTPQYSSWYKTEEKNNQPYMDIDGNIKNVAHFESQCIKYSGDVVKAIAAGVVYDGDFWDFFDKKKNKVVEKTLPVGVILTIAAAGSEGSSSMVITHSELKLKRGNIRCDAVRPKFAIMNPELTMTLPSYQTACGIVDIMVHVMERYFSNTEDCVVTDRLCEAILKSMLESGKKVLENPNDYEARANIMWASTLAHNNICGVDRVQDWASHKIEHELSAKYGVAHGAGLAVVVIKWMLYVSKMNPDKFREFGKNIFGVRTELFGTDDDYIEMGIQKLQEFWLSLGMPSSFEELGFKEEDLDYLVDHVDYTSEGTIGGYVKLDKQDVRNIYQS